ncbi:MAG: hypothetical protein MRZ79_23860 [Bacteroidia bacterium]|nr:hypothetical protein [Bacteroidia bacterium]
MKNGNSLTFERIEAVKNSSKDIYLTDGNQKIRIEELNFIEVNGYVFKFLRRKRAANALNAVYWVPELEKHNPIWVYGGRRSTRRLFSYEPKEKIKYRHYSLPNGEAKRISYKNFRKDFRDIPAARAGLGVNGTLKTVAGIPFLYVGIGLVAAWNDFFGGSEPSLIPIGTGIAGIGGVLIFSRTPRKKVAVKRILKKTSS